MTWLHAAEIVWRMLQPHTHAFVQSKKEGDADWLVRDRVFFIYQYLPDWLKYIALEGKYEPSYKYCKLSLPNGSKCWGVPQGPDQFAGFTPTVVFVDEAALQNEFEGAHTVLFPQAEKGCVMRFVSSARPGYFADVVTSDIAGETRTPIRGVQEWDLAYGGHVLRVHYSADPEKDPERDGKEWYKNETSKVAGGAQGSQWLQEMEIDFAAYSGQLVYEDFGEAHIVQPFDLSDHAGPYWRAMDYGVRNPSACLWFTELDDTYYLIREFYQAGLKVDRLKEAIAAKSPRHERYQATWIDPRADRHEEVGGSSPFFNLNRDPHSLDAIKANSSAVGIDLTREWLANNRFKVFSNCAHFIKEIRDYRYEDWTTAVVERHNLKEKPTKKDDHAMNAWKYFANGVLYREGVRSIDTAPTIRIRSRREQMIRGRRQRYLGAGTVMSHA